MSSECDSRGALSTRIALARLPAPVKLGIHPRYRTATVTCGCGETFKTRSTKEHIGVEICSKCHPFYTGRQKFVDTAGRIEKFQKKYGWNVAETAKAGAAAAAAAKAGAPAKSAK